MKSQLAPEPLTQVVASAAGLLGAEASILAIASKSAATHNLVVPVPWQRLLLETASTAKVPFAWEAPAATQLADGRESGPVMAMRLGTRGPLGVLAVLRARGGEPFTAQDLRRLAVIGALMAPAVEAQVALEAATALIEALGEAGCALDVDQLLNKALEGGARALGASGASVMLLDPDGDLVIRAARGLPDEVVRGTRRHLGEGISGHVSQTGEALLLTGAVQDSRFQGIDPAIDGAISVPLRGRAAVLGVLNFRRKAVGATFSPVELRLAMGFARGLAGALERTREEERVEDDRRQALALYELGRLGRQTRDEQDAFSQALNMACDYLQAPAGVLLARTTNGSHEWTLVAARDPLLEGTYSSRLLEQVMATAHPASLSARDVLTEPAIPWWKGGFAYLAVPIASENRPAVLVLGRAEDQPFSDTELGFSEALGMEFGSMLEGSRPPEGAEGDVNRAVADERQRISQEIHDNLAQEFSGVLLAIEGSQLALMRDPAAAQRQLAKAVRSARACLRDIRQYMASLRSAEGPQTDAVGQLGRLVQEARQQGLAVDVRFDGSGGTMTPEVQRTVLRVAQEALNNAQKHAQARKVHLALNRSIEAVVLTVEDDGIGFPVNDVVQRAPSEGRYGLLGMRERAESVGGQLELTGGPGLGTCVTLTIPSGGVTSRPATEPAREEEAVEVAPQVAEPANGDKPKGMFRRLPTMFKR